MWREPPLPMTGLEASDVGRGAGEAEVAAREIFADRTECEDRMIENVEHFAAELEVEALAEVPGFADRAVPDRRIRDRGKYCGPCCQRCRSRWDSMTVPFCT